jgi:nitronate monooxygenase
MGLAAEEDGQAAVRRTDRFAQLVDLLPAPLIVAPMTGVSSLELVDAVTRAGVIGSFPVHNCESTSELGSWLTELGAREQTSTSPLGPVVPNLIVHQTNTRREADLAMVLDHRVPAVITSVGSPADVLPPLHEADVLVLADVASMKHVHRAIAAGVDGLVLLTAGAGGQTGWANPFAFIRAVRKIWDGPLVLAGGITDGVSLLAAQVAGCDLAYMGTPFIATTESGVADEYRQAVVDASLDDIELTSAFTGLPTSMIRNLADDRPEVNGAYDATRITDGVEAIAASTFFSAGHSVAGVEHVVPAAELVARVRNEYLAARDVLREREDSSG